MSAILVSKHLDVSRDEESGGDSAGRKSDEAAPRRTPSPEPVAGVSVIQEWWNSRLRSQRLTSTPRSGRAGESVPRDAAVPSTLVRRSGPRDTDKEVCVTPSTGRHSLAGLTESGRDGGRTRRGGGGGGRSSSVVQTGTRARESVTPTPLTRQDSAPSRWNVRSGAATDRSDAPHTATAGALVTAAAASLRRRSRTSLHDTRPSNRDPVQVTDENLCGLESHPQRSPLFRSLFSTRFLLQGLDAHEPRPSLTVVLDLDETLVSNRNAGRPQAVLRPYCLHVLNALRHMAKLEIVLWTASTKDTATPVVSQLYRSGDIFDDIIFRSELWFTEPIHTKDLRLLGRDLERTIIVDNSANCCKLNPRNAILVDDFHGFCHADDASLVNVYYMIEALLKGIAEGVHVRDGLRRLAAEGHLCHSVVFPLQHAWRSLPLSEITPLKIPPCGRFVKANTAPPSRSIMKYWTM